MKKDLILSSKNNITEYLENAVKLEANIYNLEKMSEKLENEARELLENKPRVECSGAYCYEYSGEINRSYHSKECPAFDSQMVSEQITQWQDDFSMVNNKIKEYEKNIESYKKRDWDEEFRRYYRKAEGVPKGDMFLAIGLWIVVAIVGVFISGILATEAGDAIIAIVGGIMVLLLPAFIIFGYVKPNKDKKFRYAHSELIEEQRRTQNFLNNRKEKISHCNNLKAEIQNNLNDIYAKIEEGKNKYELQCRNAEKMLEEKKEIDKKIEEMKNAKKKFYSCGVVPVDYRTLDCAGVLYQIFNNDLADTMREAVLLYEERTFRGDVIKGLGSIEAQIIKGFDRMSMLMSGLCTEVRSIYNSVNQLIPTAEKILQAYEKNNQIGTSLLEEAQLGRQATSLLNENVEIMKKYYEEDRDKASEFFES